MESCRIALGEAALAEAPPRARDPIFMFARRLVRPLDVGVPVDDERLFASHQQAAQFGQRGITEFVQHVECEDSIDLALQRSEFGKGDRRYVRQSLSASLRLSCASIASFSSSAKIRTPGIARAIAIA